MSEIEIAYDRLNSQIARLTESTCDMLDRYIDPREAYMEQGERWLPIGEGGHRRGLGLALVFTEAELLEIREACRILWLENEYAINGHENRISYLVGWGHTYTIAAAGEETGNDVVERVQAFLDEWLAASKWQIRQQETVMRGDRDGEVFRRVFATDDGILKVRFVEPEQVTAPSGAKTCQSYGVETLPEDVETVVAYFVDGQRIPACEIQHLKYNVDSGRKRGLPLFYPVRKNLRRADKLLRNMSAATEIQTAIALIRKHEQATKSATRSFVNQSASQQNKSGESIFKYPAGTILDAPSGTDYSFPSQGLDPSKTIAALQAELRAVASRLVLPEFMLTSDASNANYSSTMVAEGPAVKKFQRDQQSLVEADREVIVQALRHAERCGLLKPGDVDAIRVNVEPPSVLVRDELKEAQTAQILVSMRAMSLQTAASRHGLEYQVEQENIEQHDERSGMSLAPSVELLPSPITTPSSDTAETPPEIAASDEPLKPAETGLNGIQIQSIVSIAQQIGGGTLPYETGRAIIRASFPTMSDATIDAVLNPMRGFKPPQAEAT